MDRVFVLIETAMGPLHVSFERILFVVQVVRTLKDLPTPSIKAILIVRKVPGWNYGLREAKELVEYCKRADVQALVEAYEKVRM